MSKKINLSEHDSQFVLDATGMKIGIVVSEWNPEITNSLYKAAFDKLLLFGAIADNITTSFVPGSYELTLGAQWLAENKNVDVVICLGCVIQGETRHFDFICNAVSIGLMQLNVRFSKPFIFGLLTTNDIEQAKARSGGKHGNKGDEAAVTAVKMVALKKSFSENNTSIGYL